MGTLNQLRMQCPEIIPLCQVRGVIRKIQEWIAIEVTSGGGSLLKFLPPVATSPDGALVDQQALEGPLVSFVVPAKVTSVSISTPGDMKLPFTVCPFHTRR